jgi:capsid assembly protease
VRAYRHDLSGLHLVTEAGLRQLAADVHAWIERPPQAFFWMFEDPPPAAKEKTFQQVGDAAVIPIRGYIYRRSDRWSRRFGESTQDLIVESMRDAVEDPSVSRIVLDVDSPGGAALGLGDTYDVLRALARKKPTVSVVAGYGCSAAYFLACAAPRVFVGQDSIVGSIGTFMTVTDFTKYLADLGIQEIDIVSSQSPNKLPDPKTKAGRAQLQAEVDALAQVFVEKVAEGRGVSVATVLSDFGQGGVFVGAAGVEAGLADDVSSLEQVLALLEAEAENPPAARGADEEESMNLDAIVAAIATLGASDAAPIVVALRSGAPNVVALIERDALAAANDAVALRAIHAATPAIAAAGAEAERERIRGVHEVLRGTSLAASFPAVALDGIGGRPATREDALGLVAENDRIVRAAARGRIEERDREVPPLVPSTTEASDDARFDSLRQGAVAFVKGNAGLLAR